MADDVRLIDANKLLKECIEGDGDDKFTEGYNFAVQEISAYIKDAPAVDAIPRGKWNELKETIIEMRDNDFTASTMDVCKFLTNLMEILEKEGVFSTMFCPCCGAKMYGEKMEADEDEQTQ